MKKKKIKENLKVLDGLAVAFSGGVDSTFLLKVVHDVLGDSCVALAAKSAGFPGRELQEAIDFCRKENIRQILFDFAEMQLEEYVNNSKDRCYFCKHLLFSKMKELAVEQGISVVAEGSNMDDLGDYRPGLRAIAELCVMSPLREAEFYKSEIRALSNEMGLATWGEVFDSMLGVPLCLRG